MTRSLVALGALLLLSAPLASATAQVGPYPALQPTQVASREYNFALGDFDGGTALVFQWREGMGNPRMQFTADLGLADGRGSSGLIIGGSLHYQLTRANADLPFDMVLGGGMGITAFDDGNFFRIPFGVAIGHRFPLEGEFAVSPFVHPRLSIDRTSGGGTSRSETNIDIDIGASFELNPRMQLRMAATLGNTDAVGLSFAWLPRGLR
jgi:hypothetical protein